MSGISGESVRLQIDHDGHDRTVDATDILVAAGSTPNTKDIGVEDGARLQITGSLNQAGHFVRGQHAWCPVMCVLRVRYRISRQSPLQYAPKEEPQRSDLVYNRPDCQLSLMQQMGLPLTNLIGTEPIGRFAEKTREPLDSADVAAYSF